MYITIVLCFYADVNVTQRLIFSLCFLVLTSAASAAEQLRLLMFEQPGCIYCAAWNEQIAPQYPLTTEGRSAPLRRLQLRDPLPEGLSLVSQPVFTPTFVLVRDGMETGRIEGYPGSEFFWPLLADMIEKAATN
jgi:hypothetical protein